MPRIFARSVTILLLIAGISVLPLPPFAEPSACAAPASRTGVVVAFDPINETRKCIVFAGDGQAGDPKAISALAALRKTGLQVVTNQFGSAGEFVCKIGSVGTEQDNCPASDGSYWAFFKLTQSGWQYSNLGASSVRVHDGEVTGWSWHPYSKGAPPTPTTFAQICPGDAPESPENSPLPTDAPYSERSEAESPDSLATEVTKSSGAPSSGALASSPTSSSSPHDAEGTTQTTSAAPHNDRRVDSSSDESLASKRAKVLSRSILFLLSAVSLGLLRIRIARLGPRQP